MAINEVTSIDVKTLPPFKRLIMTLGELPTSYLESMTYAELLMWFCNFLQEKVLPTINNNADALQDVIKYLEDLDLQDEVNNKLDEMAESGQLQEIIADYLNSKALFGYDTVADMKSATNLIDGSYAKTLGYYSINDGGSALYKIREITNADTIDEMFIIALNDDNLVAELITINQLNAKSIGAKGDNSTDNKTILQKGIQFCEDNNIKTFFIPNGIYYISEPIKTKSIINAGGDSSGNGIKICGENGTIITRKQNNIDPPANASDDFNNSCLAICGNNNVIENIHFQDAKIGLYIGQDPADLTNKTNAHFNKINNILCSNCGIGFDLVGGYGNYYNNFNNFKIYSGNIGIEYKKYDPSSVTSDVSNRNNFTNGEINKCFVGVRIRSNCDTNTYTGVHFEQISTTYGIGTAPSWLPNSKGVAIYFEGSSNTATNCVCEGCDLDIYDAGYSNHYLYDEITMNKIDLDNSTSIGQLLINERGGNGYVTKVGNIIQQSESIIDGYGTWNTELIRPTVLHNNLYDKNFNEINVNLASKVDTTNINLSFVGGTNNTSNDNVFYYKRIGYINFLYIKGCFQTDQETANQDLIINLPSNIVSKFSSYSNRVWYRVPVIVNSTITFAYIKASTLVIPHPSDGWKYTTGNNNSIDVNITYPTATS